MATFRRPRPTGGRHPPSLAPTVNIFKPRAEWSNAGASMFLYINLPGFYRDQIQIRSDEKTRTIQVQGQRPLSTQTRARFNEYYRVPNSCDMSKMKTSFLHGLLTIEMPILDAMQKQHKRPEELENSMQKPVGNGSVESKQPSQVETSRVAAAVKDVKAVQDKKISTIGPGKSEDEAKEEKGRTSVTDGSLDRKKHVEQISEKRLKEEESRIPAGGGGLGRDKEEKEGKAANDNVRKDKQIAETLGGTFEQNITGEDDKVVGGVGRKQPNKEERLVAEKAREEQKRKERDEVYGSLGSKKANKEEKLIDDEKAATEGQIRDVVKQGEGDLGLDIATETRNEVANVKPGLKKEETKDKEVTKPDLEESMKTKEPNVDEKDTKQTKEPGTETETKTVEDNTSEVVKDQREINGDRTLSVYTEDLRKNLLQRMDEEQIQKHGKSLMNVGVAALVIMGFGAYMFMPFIKLFY